MNLLFVVKYLFNSRLGSWSTRYSHSRLKFCIHSGASRTMCANASTALSVPPFKRAQKCSCLGAPRPARAKSAWEAFGFSLLILVLTSNHLLSGLYLFPVFSADTQPLRLLFPDSQSVPSNHRPLQKYRCDIRAYRLLFGPSKFPE